MRSTFSRKYIGLTLGLALCSSACGPRLIGPWGSSAAPVGGNLSALMTGYQTASGDFNGDGITDLAYADSATGQVTRVLGTVGCGFGSSASYPAGSKPVAVLAADFNGDGKLDLAATNSGDDSVSILLGTGTGAFGVATNYPVGTQPFGIVAGDFSGDGKTDLAVTNFGSNAVSVLLGAGTGAFGTATSFLVGSQPTGIAAGDLRRNGQLDLVVSVSAGRAVNVLLGTGTGSFGAAATYAVGDTPAGLLVADLSRDGKPDVAVANYGSASVSVLLGTGAGTLGAATDHAVGAGPVNVLALDMNRDGALDLVTANKTAQSTSLLPATGAGAFGTASPTSLTIVPVGTIATDCNNDGKIDVIAAADGGATAAAGSATGTPGTGAFSAAAGSPISRAGASGVARAVLADLNRDGKLDVLGANRTTDNITYYLGVGDGTFAAGSNVAAAGADDVHSLSTGDFNGDGWLDAVATNRGSDSYSIFLNNGAGVLLAGSNVALQSSATRHLPLATALSDFNRDGRLDFALALANFGGPAAYVQIYFGTGSGTFTFASEYALAVGAVPSSLHLADFNRDGTLDIVATSGNNNEYLLTGVANGTFNAATTIAIGSATTGHGVADFNHDGRMDLVVNTAAQMKLYAGDGAGGFAAAVNFASSSGQDALIGDFRGDSHPDIVIPQMSLGNLEVWQGSGAISGGAFTNIQNYAYPTGAGQVSFGAVGDINGDGKLDLVITEDSTASISVLLGG